MKKLLTRIAEKQSVKSQQRPRVVLITRKTLLESLLERQGTRGQAKFFLRARGQTIESFEASHERFEQNLGEVLSVIPSDQRRVHVDRDDLDRFLFAPDDIVLVVGQDGLVPNAAKYLNGQLVIGVNPDPTEYDGVLCRYRPDQILDLVRWAEGVMSAGGEVPADSPFTIQQRTMAVAVRDDGLKLLSLNELYIGHMSHQSSKYRIVLGDRMERQSSSGVICSTGTGCTGWARSIAEQRCLEAPMPRPWEPSLAWFVREPFPSVSTGTAMSFGVLGKEEEITLYSEMGDGGVVFADGIEQDRMDFLSGQFLNVRVAGRTLNLVAPAES